MKILTLLLLLSLLLSDSRLFAQFSGKDSLLLDAEKFERTGMSAWKKREYQHAIDNFMAMLTYPLSPEKYQTVRDMISQVESDYRGYLKYQRDFSRRMERSNELLVHADIALKNKNRRLALQLVHYACRISRNTNVMALKLRNNLQEDGAEDGDQHTVPPKEDQPDIPVIYTVSPMDSNYARAIIFDRGRPDTVDLPIPPVESMSLLSNGHKMIVLCKDHTVHLMNLKTGETKPIPNKSASRITSVALWRSDQYYAIGYASGLFEVYAKDHVLLFSHVTSGPVLYLTFLGAGSSKKGTVFSFLFSNGSHAVIREFKYKNGVARPDDEILLAENIAAGTASRDGKLIALLTKKNGFQLFSGTGKSRGDVKYPFAAYNFKYKIKYVSISDDNEKLLFEILRHEILDNSQATFVEKVRLSGEIEHTASFDLPKEKKPGKKDAAAHAKPVESDIVEIRFIRETRQWVYLTRSRDSVFIARVKPFVINFKLGAEKNRRITSVEPDPLGKYIVAGTGSDTTYLFNLTTKSRLTMRFEQPLSASAFSGKGDYFVCGHGKKLTLHNLPDGSVWTSCVFEAPVSALASSPSGDTIMVGLEDGQVLYIPSTDITKTLNAGLGRSAGPVKKVSFSKKGSKSLILSRDKLKGKSVLDVVSNNPANSGYDRRHYYESPDEYGINYAEFSGAEDMILLTRKNKMLMLSADFLKPEYEIMELNSPYQHDEIKEAYLLENEKVIATISQGGDLRLQADPIAELDAYLDDMSLSDQIKYKVADPDSLLKYAATPEEMDKSIAYVAEYYMNEEDQRDSVRSVLIQLLTKRVARADEALVADSAKIARYYFMLAKAYHEQSMNAYDQLEPEEALIQDTFALNYILESRKYFSNMSDTEKKQVEEKVCRIYANLARLSICDRKRDQAQQYIKASEPYLSAVPASGNINRSSEAMISVLSGNLKIASDLFTRYKDTKCSDDRGSYSMWDIFWADLDYLTLIFRLKPSPKKYFTNIESAKRRLLQMKRKH